MCVPIVGRNNLCKHKLCFCIDFSLSTHNKSYISFLLLLCTLRNSIIINIFIIFLVLGAKYLFFFFLIYEPQIDNLHTCSVSKMPYREIEPKALDLQSKLLTYSAIPCLPLLYINQSKSYYCWCLVINFPFQQIIK